MTLADQLAADAAAVAARLSALIAADTGPADRLQAAMHYAATNGGKRLRGALVMGSARLAAANTPSDDVIIGAERTAAALEALHAYSLIHDDLPAMDDADLRRGVPSCHIKFDEATAILAGDALQTLSFEILAAPETHIDPAIRIRLVSTLAKASGLAGMAGGQMLDLQAEDSDFDLDRVKTMQAMKTGALIRASAVCGGIVGGADDKLMTALDGFSRDLGLAFQIADDLLDYQSDAAILGKPTGQDAERGKGSFVTLMGLSAAKRAAADLIENATNQLAPWGVAADYLQSLAIFAVARKS